MTDSDQFYSVKRLSDSDFQKLSRYIEKEVGIKMPPAKRTLLESRLQKRLKKLGLSSFNEYSEILFNSKAGSDEIQNMIDEVTTNKTDFWREPAHFEYLLSDALPELIATGIKDVKIWSVASSIGLEAYNIAMVVEEFRKHHPQVDYRILGTDICRSALDKARMAIYPSETAVPLPMHYKKSYLLRSKNREEDQVRVKPELRRKAVFSYINLMWQDYNIAERFNIVFCRNVLIYFDKQTQQLVLNRILNLMTPGSYLFLGHSESQAGFFLPLKKVSGAVYRKTD